MYFYVGSFQNQCHVPAVQVTLCRCFHVRGNLCLIHFEYFREKTLRVEGNIIPKTNLKCTCRFTRLLNLDTVRIMSRTNTDCATPFSCK